MTNPATGIARPMVCTTPALPAFAQIDPIGHCNLAAGELLPCCMVATADRASFGNVFETAGGEQDGLLQR